MINRQSVSPQKERIQNNTNQKQRQSMLRYSFKAEMDEDDRQIQVDSIHQQQSKYLLTSPPRKSIIQQNQIWQGQIYHNQVYIHSDEYYNDHVAIETNAFLRKMIVILDEQSQFLIMKRKHNVDMMLDRIKNQFKNIKMQLIDTVNSWCKTAEQQEIHSFLERGEIDVNGELLQTFQRIKTKRQDIEEKIFHIQNTLNQQKPITHQQLVGRSLRIKKNLREVWDKEYENSVAILKRQCQNLKNKQIIPIFMTNLGKQYEHELKKHVHKTLQDFELFYTNEGNVQSQIKQQKIKRRQIILQSLMDLRSSQIQNLKRSHLHQLSYSKSKQNYQ